MVAVVQVGRAMRLQMEPATGPPYPCPDTLIDLICYL